MTPPPAQPLTDEQRIASLEAQLVTMRGALEEAEKNFDKVEPVLIDLGFTAYPLLKQIRSALASTADYEGKVVVDRDEMKLMELVVTKASRDTALHHRSKIADWECVCPLCDSLARLDAIRKGGKG